MAQARACSSSRRGSEVVAPARPPGGQLVQPDLVVPGQHEGERHFGSGSRRGLPPLADPPRRDGQPLGQLERGLRNHLLRPENFEDLRSRAADLAQDLTNRRQPGLAGH